MPQPLLTRLIWVFCTLCLWGPVRASAQPAATLEDYLAHAEQHHPRLTAARARSEVARQMATVAGSLPDLKLGWGEMLVPVETRVGAQQRMLSVSQNIPWFGTLGAREDAAVFRAEAAGGVVTQERLVVRGEVLKSWFALAALQGESDLVQKHLALSRQAEEAARGAYEAGAAPLARVLRARMESLELRTRQESLQDRIGPATMALNTAAAMDVPITPVAWLPAGSLEWPLPVDLEHRLQEGNPHLETLQLEELSGQKMVDAARLSGRPGFSVGLDYIMTAERDMPGVEDNGKDPLIARLAISVPLWSGKATARRLASASRLQATTAKLEKVRLELDRELEDILFRIRRDRRRQDLHRDDLLPLAHQILTITRSDYETGRTGFSEVIAASRNILELETELLEARADEARALVDLDILLGGSGLSFIREESETP